MGGGGEFIAKSFLKVKNINSSPYDFIAYFYKASNLVFFR